ncbi:hypothetical protein C8J57DRAFT_1297014 [Mycena rebaudengoi]|nr:hypothetical protein C8J57DRAFT_1297014 [Mycena rebaudengoi]
MSALRDLGHNQRLVFRNLKVGNAEISTLLDTAVFQLLPTEFMGPPTPVKNAIEFRSAGSKGMGAFAAQNLCAAALILVEYPTTVVQNTIVLNFSMTMSETYRELIQRVPAKTQPLLLKLHNAQPLKSCEWEEAILRSNAIGISIPTPANPGSFSMGHNGVFLEMSRFNHSCSPNISHRFDPRSFTLSVHTLRPITKGEELVHSYLDLPSTITRQDRRTRLKELCHFECRCDACSVPCPAESDHRRTAIRNTTREAVFEPLRSWSRGGGRGDLYKVVDFHFAAVEDMIREGLYHPPYSLHVTALAICFAALEDWANFRVWIEKARVAAICPFATETAAEMAQYLAHPETFPQWALVRRIRMAAPAIF